MKKIINYFKSISKQTNQDSFIKKYDVIIHIGAPKTGSSAIQKFLLENRDTLAKNGYYYPEHGLDENGISGGHSSFGLSLINNDIEKAQVIFKDYITTAKEKELALLLSAESLFDHYEKLALLMQNYTCNIIVFFREPVEALFSNYNQSIKRHFNTIHINQVCNNALLSNNIGNSAVYGKWLEFFGKENVTILEYNLEYFKKHSIQEVFLMYVGLNKKIIKQIMPKNFQRINKSYTLAELEFKRVLNNVLDKENKKENFEIDWQLQKLSDAKQEEHTLMDELSYDLYKKLYEKFKIVREKLMGYGMICLDRLDSTKREHQQNKYFYQNKINDILAIIEHLKKEKPEIYRYIVSKILGHVQDQKKFSYEIISLAEWFNIDYEMIPYKNEPLFSQAQLNNIAEGKYKEADFLRDIATILLKKGDMENANKLVSKALELRPTGSAIIQLKQKIMEHK